MSRTTSRQSSYSRAKSYHHLWYIYRSTVGFNGLGLPQTLKQRVEEGIPQH